MAVKMDTHIHTSFSTDSETDMQEQILTSYKKGLEGICITDHMDYNFPESALEHPVDGIPFCFDLDYAKIKSLIILLAHFIWLTEKIHTIPHFGKIKNQPSAFKRILKRFMII